MVKQAAQVFARSSPRARADRSLNGHIPELLHHRRGQVRHARALPVHEAAPLDLHVPDEGAEVLRERQHAACWKARPVRESLGGRWRG